MQRRKPHSTSHSKKHCSERAARQQIKKCFVSIGNNKKTMGPLPLVSWFCVVMAVVCSVAANEKQRELLEKFRSAMRDKIPKTSNLTKWMDDDLYVTNWLRLGGGDLEKAKTRFQQHLTWRETEKVDTLHLEDWSDYSEEFPVNSDTFDKWGRPTMEALQADWDVRRAVMSGRSKKFIRWGVFNQEKMQDRLYETRRQGNINVTGVATIIDCQGMNMYKQFCVPCQSVLRTAGEISEYHYFYVWERTFLVNMGPAAHAMIKTMFPLYNTKGYNAKFKFLHGRREWLPVLNENFDFNQRSVRLGGTKIRH